MTVRPVHSSAVPHRQRRAQNTFRISDPAARQNLTKSQELWRRQSETPEQTVRATTGTMLDRLALVLRWLRALCRLRGDLALENLALRQQLTVLSRHHRTSSTDLCRSVLLGHAAASLGRVDQRAHYRQPVAKSPRPAEFIGSPSSPGTREGQPIGGLRDVPVSRRSRLTTEC
jgi:hypothetical protein